MRGQNSVLSMWLAVGLAVLLIYVLLAVQFESYIDPLATVVIGGLIASTILSLLVVPTLYLVVAKRLGNRFRSRRRIPSNTAELQPNQVR
jgi:multidrug efflux pump subunit AcrB